MQVYDVLMDDCKISRVYLTTSVLYLTETSKKTLLGILDSTTDLILKMFSWAIIIVKIKIKQIEYQISFKKKSII